MIRDFLAFSRTCIFFLLTLSLLFSDSSHLCFSPFHTVRSLTSKFSSINDKLYQLLEPSLESPWLLSTLLRLERHASQDLLGSYDQVCRIKTNNQFFERVKLSVNMFYDVQQANHIKPERWERKLILLLAEIIISEGAGNILSQSRGACRLESHEGGQLRG